MGNASSSEEANGTAIGGFFGLIGSLVVSVICPPAAIIAIPAGFGAHTYGMATLVKYDTTKPPELKKTGTTGDFIGGLIQGATIGGLIQAGVNYKDTDERPHLHYCPVSTNPIEMREKAETKAKYEKYIKEEQIKLEHKKFNTYLASNFQKIDISFEFQSNKSYWFFHYYYQADTNFNNYKMLNFLDLHVKNLKYKDGLTKFNSSLGTKTVYVYMSISNLPKIIELWKHEQNISMKKAGAHLVKAVVYGLNGLEIAKSFETEANSLAYGMYANQMDESFKNYCCELKSAILEVVNEVKKTYTTGRKLAIMENTINSMYDEVAKFNASKKSICSKYGTYVDGEKYRLTIEERASKVEEFLKKDFNTTEYHIKIYDLIKKTKELLK